MNKKLFGLLSVISTSVLALTVVFAAKPDWNNGFALMARGGGGYSCSSIHFGMDDSTLMGNWSGSGSTWAPDTDGITIRSHSENARVYYSENNALKFNSGSVFDGAITLTLDYNISQCTVYAAGWKDKTPTLDINGISHEITGNDSVTGSNGTVVYTPYTYTLPEESNILTLSALNERLVIGDIALRKTSYIPIMQCTISFDANGGTGEKESETVDSGTVYTLPAADTFTAPTGKEFDSWSLDRSTPIEGSTIIVNNNITLYAMWKIKDTSYTSATMAAGTNGSTCTVNNKSGIKIGTSKAGGTMTITVPTTATELVVYAAAWNGVSGLSLNISGATTDPASIALNANTGIANNSPFTLSTGSNEDDYKFTINLSNITTGELTLTTSIAKRCVVWNAQYK